jgi:uncharacterized protein (TIGR04255 family)
MYDGREVYANAPLAIVTAEIRFGYEPRLRNDVARDRFAEAVRDTFPRLSAEQALTITVTGAEGASPTAEPQVRATRSDQQATVSLNASALNLSMSGRAYVDYDSSFAPLMAVAVGAVREAAGDVPIQRLGLRYIDEIRPPQHPAGSDWSIWVNGALLGATHALSDPVAGHRSMTTFSRGGGRTVTFNAGQFDGSTVVDVNLPFSSNRGRPGPLFVIDVDSAWEPEEHTPLNPSTVAEILADLHAPVGGVFQWSITDAARALFRQPKEDS